MRESDFFDRSEERPHPEWWNARDAEGSEYEVGDFLYGLVRLLQPELVLETGCYLGDSSIRLAEALKANGHGKLITCDTDSQRVEATKNRLAELPAEVLQIPGEHLTMLYPDVDLAFIDSNGDRPNEIKNLARAFVVLHDARWYENKEMFFPTPRGLSLFKVKHGETKS